MPKINQFGFAPLLILVIVLILGAAIFIGVNLSGEKQDLTSSAAESLVQDREFGSTPISEIPKIKRPANGIKLWPGQMKITYNATVLDFIATHYEYVHLDSIDKQEIKFLDNRNPNIKIIVAVGGVATMLPSYEVYKYLKESDFLHRKSDSSKKVILQSNEVLNIGSDTVRRNLVSGLSRILTDTPGIDGLLFDGYHPWGDWLTEECVEAPDCNKQRWFSPATREQDYWYSGYKAFNRLARASINQNKELFFNGFNPTWGPTADVGTAYNGWASDFNGSYIEHFEYAWIKPEYFDRGLKSIQELVDQGKIILFNAEPGLLLGTNGGNIPPKTLDLQRFFLASFLLINDNKNTYYGYVPGEPDPNKISNVYFYKDWYLDYGTPTDVYRGGETPDIYYRHYSNGMVVVNASDTEKDFRFPVGYGKVWKWMEGYIEGFEKNSPSQYTTKIPPKSGIFFAKVPFITQACNGFYCIDVRARGCNSNAPYYLLGWSQTVNPSFAYYLLMMNNAQSNGTITPASQTSMWTNTNSSASHSFYIRARMSNGVEEHTGTLTMPNECL